MENRVKEIGTINKIEGKNIFLTCGNTAACESCAAGAFCKTKGRDIIALNPQQLSLSTGDQVEFFLPPGRTIFAGFSVLIFPLLTFVAGFLLCSSLLPESGEGIRTLCGIGGLILGFLLSSLYNKALKDRNYPEITRKIDPSGS